jgi:nicotinate phosphoribosyltransferase
MGETPNGIRLDSGDLAALSIASRELIDGAAAKLPPEFADKVKAMKVVASDDLDEGKLRKLNAKGHKIDSYGIGTHLVTCKAQPALGMVYKLAEVEGDWRMKLSAVASKSTHPGRKEPRRLMMKGAPVADILQSADEPAPTPSSVFWPLGGAGRVSVGFDSEEPLLKLLWDGPSGTSHAEPLKVARDRCQKQLKSFKSLFPSPLDPKADATGSYMVARTDSYKKRSDVLWEKTSPVPEHKPSTG